MTTETVTKESTARGHAARAAIAASFWLGVMLLLKILARKILGPSVRADYPEALADER